MPPELVKPDVNDKLLRKLGRRRAVDPKDKLFRMAAVLPRRPPVSSRFWVLSDILDQGNTPRCVAFSWGQMIQCSPTRTKLTAAAKRQKYASPESFLSELYKNAQRIDEWPGEDYDGTSVRAGAKVLETWGYLSEYVWAWDADTVRLHVLARGPVVVGTWWYRSMFWPHLTGGYLKAEGARDGGHAWLVHGYSLKRKAFRMVNSWGANWGERGKAWVDFAVMERLLSEDGEACSALESKLAA